MGSNSKGFEVCGEDRISKLPDAILSHIISFLETRDAVKTCLLSHRWNNVWTYVPNLAVYVSQLRFPDKHVRETGFVDLVLLFHNLSNVQKFHLSCDGVEDYFDHVDAWICTAIRRNVVELVLDLWTASANSYIGCLKLPTRIFICKTLVSLKLLLTDHLVAIPPNSTSCFPSLKHLNVELFFPVAVASVAKLFSCSFCALEDLIIHGNVGRLDDEVLNLTISAPKLKRLRLLFCAVDAEPYATDDGGYEYKFLLLPMLQTLKSSWPSTFWQAIL